MVIHTHAIEYGAVSYENLVHLALTLHFFCTNTNIEPSRSQRSTLGQGQEWKEEEIRKSLKVRGVATTYRRIAV